MKKRFHISLFVFFLIFISCGCGAINTDPTEQIKEEKGAQDNYSEKIELTKEEKLEDFEYLSRTLKSNYPYFEINKRLYGVDWIGNEESYRERIKESEGDLQFCQILKSIMKDLNYKHARVLDDFEYVYFLSLYRNVNAEPWIDVLEESPVRDRYSYAVEEICENAVVEIQPHQDNLTLETCEEISTAYIKIKSFDQFNIENDWQEMQPFIEELDGYQSLIIDIRGNTGGDSHYWSDYLVPELIYEPTEFTQYFCFRGGAYAEGFIKYEMGVDYCEMEAIDKMKNEISLSNEPSNLLSDFKYYVKRTDVIEPVDHEGYQGDIYLLVDQSVFSSSDKFVQFAQDTEFAYIIGESTSGEGSGFDCVFLSLPNSGYVVCFPVAMVLSSDGTNREEVRVTPDLETEGSLALEEAIKLIKAKQE